MCLSWNEGLIRLILWGCYEQSMKCDWYTVGALWMVISSSSWDLSIWGTHDWAGGSGS